MKQSERFQAERGLSPAAFVGGTFEEMKRIPEWNPQPGFGGDSPEFADRGSGGDKPDFADLASGKCKGRTGRDQITFYRDVGNQGLQFSSVGGWVYEQAVRQRKAAKFRPSGSRRTFATDLCRTSLRQFFRPLSSLPFSWSIVMVDERAHDYEVVDGVEKSVSILIGESKPTVSATSRRLKLPTPATQSSAPGKL